MPSTFTVNLNLELQATGEHSGTWGSSLNTADFAILDDALGGLQSVSLSASNVTLNTTQTQKNAYLLTGVLLANVVVIWPAIGRTYFVANNTTGAFTVTLRAGSGSATVVVPQGAAGYYTISGNSVYQPTRPGVDTGFIGMFASSTVPTGYLECNGAAVSRTTYSSLFGVIGTTWGVGDGSTTFNLPDFRGYFARGWDHGAGVDPGRAFASTQTSANLEHTHTGIAASHTHTVTASGSSRRGANGNNVGTNWYGSSGDSNDGGTGSRTTAASGDLTLTIANSGGTEARPVNKSILMCIKT